MPARTTFAPDFCIIVMICSRLARVVPTGSPRNFVVATEDSTDHDGMISAPPYPARSTPSVRGIAAHPGVDYVILVTARINLLLQEIRIAFPGIGAEPRRQAVAEGHYCRPWVWFLRQRQTRPSSCSAAAFSRGRLRLLAAATCHQQAHIQTKEMMIQHV